MDNFPSINRRCCFCCKSMAMELKIVLHFTFWWAFLPPSQQYKWPGWTVNMMLFCLCSWSLGPYGWTFLSFALLLLFLEWKKKKNWDYNDFVVKLEIIDRLDEDWKISLVSMNCGFCGLGSLMMRSTRFKVSSLLPSLISFFLVIDTLDS